MKRVTHLIAVLLVGLYSVCVQAAGHAPTEITVGYLQQWPTPAQFSQAKQTYDSVLGIRVNWRPFADGNLMNAALAAGEVQIAYAHGLLPFTAGVTAGLELTAIGIAVDYAENDLCIVGSSTGISRANAAWLEGRRVATVVGGVTHYKMLKVLEHLQVDTAGIEIVPMATDAEAASALRRGEVAMACAHGKALQAMADLGQPLMTGTEQAGIGLKLFDLITVPNAFLQQHPEIVQGFMDVTEASNFQWRKNPEPMRAAIARAADMDTANSDRALAQFEFPTAVEQKSPAWLGESLPAYTKAVADFMVAEGQLNQSLDSYDRFFTTRFLR